MSVYDGKSEFNSKILLPVDSDGEKSGKIISIAVQMANAMGAKVYGLHVVDSTFNGSRKTTRLKAEMGELGD